MLWVLCGVFNIARKDQDNICNVVWNLLFGNGDWSLPAFCQSPILLLCSGRSTQFLIFSECSLNFWGLHYADSFKQLEIENMLKPRHFFLKVALLDNLANRSGLHRRFRAELANSLHLYSAAGKEMEGGFRSRWSKEAFCILHFSKSDAESFWSRCGFCFYISQGMCERALIPETLRSEMLWLNRPWRGATAASLWMLSTSPTSPFSKDSY